MQWIGSPDWTAGLNFDHRSLSKMVMHVHGNNIIATVTMYYLALFPRLCIQPLILI